MTRAEAIQHAQDLATRHGTGFTVWAEPSEWSDDDDWQFARSDMAGHLNLLTCETIEVLPQ